MKSYKFQYILIGSSRNIRTKKQCFFRRKGYRYCYCRYVFTGSLTALEAVKQHQDTQIQQRDYATKMVDGMREGIYTLEGAKDLTSWNK